MTREKSLVNFSTQSIVQYTSYCIPLHCSRVIGIIFKGNLSWFTYLSFQRNCEVFISKSNSSSPMTARFIFNVFCGINCIYLPVYVSVRALHCVLTIMLTLYTVYVCPAHTHTPFYHKWLPFLLISFDHKYKSYESI